MYNYNLDTSSRLVSISIVSEVVRRVPTKHGEMKGSNSVYFYKKCVNQWWSFGEALSLKTSQSLLRRISYKRRPLHFLHRTDIFEKWHYFGRLLKCSM